MDRHEKRKRLDDLIISASSKRFIGPIAGRPGVNCIASDYDRDVGAFIDNLMYTRGKAAYLFELKKAHEKIGPGWPIHL